MGESNIPPFQNAGKDTSSLLVDGIRVPRFLYGTAWKEDDTRRLVELALQSGFRGIDTANQRKHYHEAAVGAGIAAQIRAGIVARDELFLQTKFTFRAGQDDRLPYDPAAPIATQVVQSFESSLHHLRATQVDSYLLHGPSTRTGLAAADREAWQAMEQIYETGRSKLLGISNVSREQLERLCSMARIPPRIVQNRCYAVHGWDRDVREFCRANQILYEGFSLLTANRQVLAHPEIASIAKRHGLTAAQVLFRFAIDIGMVPLTGTTSPTHMQLDLQVADHALSRDEIHTIEHLAMQ